MPQLLTPRKGWENESLAAYLLSRVSFIARPTSVADDVGTDFFCTLFEIEDRGGSEALLPRNSFAIQVKSSASEIRMENKIDYLSGLELPFFVGVVSQRPPELNIYSAELLPVLFSECGNPDQLSLLPVTNSDFDPNKYFERLGESNLQLRCPLTTTLTVEDDRPRLTAKVQTLLNICNRAHRNIATRLNEEHIYDLDGKGNVRILAGSGSVRYFRTNFLKRLGEVFYNLEWIVRAGGLNSSVISEIELFDSFCEKLKNVYGSLPPYVSTPCDILKARLRGQPS